MPEPARPRYHHGNLRAALIDAGLELARAGGPDAIVVREASRRVGVSHNAAYRHFPDRDALLTEVAERCMNALAALMQEMLGQVAETPDTAQVARDRLQAVGTAYVRFALSEPGWFRTAFAPTAFEGPPSAHPPSADGTPDGPYQLLGAQLDGLVAAGVMAPDRRPGAETTAWSGVHGLSCLLLDGPLRALSEPEREAALERLLDDLGAGLTAPLPMVPSRGAPAPGC